MSFSVAEACYIFSILQMSISVACTSFSIYQISFYVRSMLCLSTASSLLLSNSMISIKNKCKQYKGSLIYIQFKNLWDSTGRVNLCSTELTPKCYRDPQRKQRIVSQSLDHPHRTWNKSTRARISSSVSPAACGNLQMHQLIRHHLLPIQQPFLTTPITTLISSSWAKDVESSSQSENLVRPATSSCKKLTAKPY